MIQKGADLLLSERSAGAQVMRDRPGAADSAEGAAALAGDVRHGAGEGGTSAALTIGPGASTEASGRPSSSSRSITPTHSSNPHTQTSNKNHEPLEPVQPRPHPPRSVPPLPARASWLPPLGAPLPRLATFEVPLAISLLTTPLLPPACRHSHDWRAHRSRARARPRRG